MAETNSKASYKSPRKAAPNSQLENFFKKTPVKSAAAEPIEEKVKEDEPTITENS